MNGMIGVGLNIIYMWILPKLIYSFNTISTKISTGFFLFGWKLQFNFLENCSGPIIVKIALKKKKLHFFPDYKASRYRHKDRETDIWNRIENPEIYITNGARMIWYLYVKEINFDS